MAKIDKKGISKGGRKFKETVQAINGTKSKPAPKRTREIEPINGTDGHSKLKDVTATKSVASVDLELDSDNKETSDVNEEYTIEAKKSVIQESSADPSIPTKGTKIKKAKVPGLKEPTSEKSSKSLPTPLSLEVLSKSENKAAKKPVPALEPEQSISANISLEQLKQKNKRIKKANSQKNFGEIKVKVLKPKAPWDLPPIKIDKSAYDFLQTSLYGSRAFTRRRNQVGLPLDPNSIGPAPKFIRKLS